MDSIEELHVHSLKIQKAVDGYRKQERASGY